MISAPRALIAAGALAAAGLAQSTTIGFDPLTSTLDRGIGMTYQESGFTFASTYHADDALIVWSAQNAWNADPGGATLIEDYRGESLVVTASHGGTFSLASFDLADGFNTGDGGPVTMRYTDATGVHQQQLVLDDQRGLQTFQFGYAGLTSFSLLQSTPYFQIDNVVVQTTPIPEPASLALMLAGLGAIGVATRRRRA